MYYSYLAYQPPGATAATRWLKIGAAFSGGPTKQARYDALEARSRNSHTSRGEYYATAQYIALKRIKASHAGTRTRVARVKAGYPNRLDYMGYL